MKPKHLFLIVISIIVFSCNSSQKNKEEKQKTVKFSEENKNSANIKNMYPILGQKYDFSPQKEKDWQKCEKIVHSVDYDYEQLTKEQLAFLDKTGFEEMKSDCWDIIGEGCSWHCAGGPDSVTASSYLKSKNTAINYLPENAHDLSYKTAWVEGVKGYGTGEYLVYHFRPQAPRITDIIIANGYIKSKIAYYDNSRVKKLKMYIDDKPFAILNLEDCLREQVFTFAPIGNNPDDENSDKQKEWTIKFEILEVYKGDKYDDTAISEIYFDGIDVHCFGAGTKILMADNSLKNIELISENDIIKSYDFKNKKLVNSKVAKLISVKHTNLFKLKFADNEIVTTADHPFWIERNVWAAVNAEKANSDYFQDTKVEELKFGDKIFIPAKNIFSEIICMEEIENQQITYTIELLNNNNFIANGMSVKTEKVK